MSTTDLTRAVRFFCLVLTTSVLAQESPVKICLGEADRNRALDVSLSCSPGMVISVVEAFFGNNQWGLCFYTEDDCTEDISSFEFCNQKRNCTRTFNGTYTPRCGYSTFLTVVYECVPGVIPTLPTRVDPVPDPRHNRPTTTRAPSSRHVGSLDPVVTPKSRDDTALIAGCAVAVVVTMTTLVIAIVLVVRRLFCIPHGGVHQSPKKSRISMFICSKLGCVLARCRNSEHEEGGNSLPQAEEPDLEVEGRVTPLGADAVEVVNELGQPDVTSEQNTSANGQDSASGSSDSRMHRVTNVPFHTTNTSASRDLVNRPDGSPVPGEPRNSQRRMDAVALPNTELSTLC